MTLHRRVNGNLEETFPDKVFYENGQWKFQLEGKVFLIPQSNYPAYEVGEIVAVAQSYKDVFSSDYLTPQQENEIISLMEKNNPGCTNKMFVRADLMPHQIRITGLRIERLQEITEEDFLKEVGAGYSIPCKRPKQESLSDYKKVFEQVIDGTGRKGTWRRNPYVWVYDFELIK